jgi:hypothetical protein
LESSTDLSKQFKQFSSGDLFGSILIFSADTLVSECDSCQLVQEVQHERSIKGSSQKGENIRKSLKQNIGVRKAYSGKHDIPCNLETEGKSAVLISSLIMKEFNLDQ